MQIINVLADYPVDFFGLCYDLLFIRFAATAQTRLLRERIISQQQSSLLQRIPQRLVGVTEADEADLGLIYDFIFMHEPDVIGDSYVLGFQYQFLHVLDLSSDFRLNELT